MSDGNALGVAMTVTVVRNGKIKSYIYFDLRTVAPLFTESRRPDYAVHAIGHECSRVELTANFDRCFPGQLQNCDLSALEEIRWDMALGCVDEYLVTRVCATYSADVMEPYEDLFLEALAACPAEADMEVRAFALHGDRLKVLIGVHRAYGTLIKRAAYHLGNLDGHRRGANDLPKTRQAVAGHWLGLYIQRFHEAFRQLAENYSEWTNPAPFMTVALLYEEMLADVGVIGKDKVLWASFAVSAAVTVITKSEVVWLIFGSGVLVWLLLAPPTWFSRGQVNLDSAARRARSASRAGVQRCSPKW